MLISDCVSDVCLSYLISVVAASSLPLPSLQRLKCCDHPLNPPPIADSHSVRTNAWKRTSGSLLNRFCHRATGAKRMTSGFRMSAGSRSGLRWSRHPDRLDHQRVNSRSSASSRSEEHTSELQSLMRHSYTVYCLKNTKQIYNKHQKHKQITP